MSDGKFKFSLGGSKAGSVNASGSLPPARAKQPPPVFECSSDEDEASEAPSKRQRCGSSGCSRPQPNIHGWRGQDLSRNALIVLYSAFGIDSGYLTSVQVSS